jgi:hypothetical protein
MVIHNKFIYWACLLVSVPFVFLSNSAGIAGKSTTGCGGNGCHQASSNTSINVTGIPVSGFKHDSVYTMTLTVSNSIKLKAGFDLTVNRGELLAGTGYNSNGTKEILHNAPKNIVSGNVTWDFQWKAPSSGDSAVVFFVAANAVDANTHPSNDEFETNNFLFDAIPSVTSIQELDIQTIKCYPNPASSILYCKNDFENKTSYFYITDFMGKIHTVQPNNVDQNRYLLDVSSLPNGSYMLIRESENQKSVGHFLKHE